MQEPDNQTSAGRNILNWRQFSLNKNGILCFVLATFNFELNFNPLLKGAVLKNDYRELLEEWKKHEEFKCMYSSMLEFNNLNANSNKVAWNFSSVYLEIVWNIEKGKADIILLTTYAVYLTKVRQSIKKRISDSINELAIKTDLHN